MTQSYSGYYKAKECIRICCGVSAFTLSEGSRVFVEKFDQVYDKVLVRYSSRDIDWMPVRTFNKCFER